MPSVFYAVGVLASIEAHTYMTKHSRFWVFSSQRKTTVQILGGIYTSYTVRCFALSKPFVPTVPTHLSPYF